MKKILVITCTSFTAIVLLFALFSTFDMVPELSKSIILQLFAMASSISVLMFISDKIAHKLDINSIVIDALIRVLICYFVVFTEGSLFGMFPFEWKAFAYISPVLIPTFIATYAIYYFTLVDYANEINERIKKKKNYF
ncbi:DUF3021 family protein [Cellulosilyticum sp. I15G10I2]|uniref:DUF3021 family protein n=1 Tax=Cellulosilyticum sp. I15G10I2 TaxID=1892843 RepID=UPI00085CA194|nr:DUF3021 family protein [Cellulosilyticum sp. I15G10I2]